MKAFGVLLEQADVFRTIIKSNLSWKITDKVLIELGERSARVSCIDLSLPCNCG